MHTIDFIYDFTSPNAYAVHHLLPAIAARHGARITYTPALLGGIFKATGNQSPALAGVTGKMDYLLREIERFVKRHDVPFTFSPYFPIHSIAMMRGALYAIGKPWESQYRDAMFRHCWVEGTNLSETETFIQTLEQEGLPNAEIAQAIQSPDIKQALFIATEAVVARGVFGVPTMFVGSDMFFGKESLIDLEEHLSTMPQT